MCPERSVETDGRPGRWPGLPRADAVIGRLSRRGPVLLVVVASAIAAVASGGEPTTLGVANVVWLALVGGGVVWAAAEASTRALVWLAAIGVLAGALGAAIPVGVALLAMAFAVVSVAVGGRGASGDRRRQRLLAAVSAGLALWVLQRQELRGFHGASALVTMIALAPMAWPLVCRWVHGARAQRRSWTRRRRRLVTAAMVAPMVVLGGAVGLALWANSQVQASLASARAGRTEVGAAELGRALTGFDASHRLTRFALAPLRVVPVLSQHLALLEETTSQGAAVAGAGRQVLEVSDYGDLKTADGRIDLDRISALTEPVERAEGRLVTARRRVARAGSPWLAPPISGRLDRALVELDQVIDQADLVGEAARTVPGMLGAEGERVWFVAFVNPAEQRGGGGFLGSYAELRADDGRLEMTRSGSVLDLIAAAPPGARTLTGPREYLERYGQFRPADFFQDLTYSPHFPYTADVISQLYPQSGGTRLDGVISADPLTLAALLRITGPVQIDGLDRPLTAENAARTILRDQYVLFDADASDDQTARRDVLDQAASKTFRSLLDGPLPTPRLLGEALGPMVDQRRLQLAARQPGEQAFIRRLGADGALFADEPGDYLMVSHQNRGNSKIDAFLLRSTTYRAVVDPDTGMVDATVTIEMLNSAPTAGLPGYVIGNSRGEPSGTNLMNLSVYSHLGLRGVTVEGEQVGASPGQEAGARVITLPVAIPAGDKITVVVELGGTLDSQDGFRLRAVPQPGVLPEFLTLDVQTPGADPATLAERPLGVFERPEVLSD